MHTKGKPRRLDNEEPSHENSLVRIIFQRLSHVVRDVIFRLKAGNLRQWELKESVLFSSAQFIVCFCGVGLWNMDKQSWFDLGFISHVLWLYGTTSRSYSISYLKMGQEWKIFLRVWQSWSSGWFCEWTVFSVYSILHSIWSSRASSSSPRS